MVIRISRREILASAALLPAWSVLAAGKGAEAEPIQRVGGARIRYSLNAYSFNSMLRNGEMNLDQLLDFCARHNFDAVDLTGYYFPGYPSVPSEEVNSQVKKRAYQLGLDISGTGIRNDFRHPDAERRAADVVLTQEWLQAAARLGAPALRVFAGRSLEEGQSREQANRWVVDCLDEGKIAE